MSKKIYVINEISFEYNDEYYYQGESEGGEPVQAYSTKEKAQAAIPELTKKWILDNSTSDWMSVAEYGGYDGGAIDLHRFAAEASLDFNEVEKTFENYDTKKINQMLRDNIDAAVKSLKLRLFKIKEIELA